MITNTLFVHGDLGRVHVTSDQKTVWVRSELSTVGLTLTVEQRAALREALSAVDVKQQVPA